MKSLGRPRTGRHQALSAGSLASRVARVARRVEWGTAEQVARSAISGFRRNNLSIYASAIAFQVFFAIIPLLLVAIALLGFLHLDGVWGRDIALDVRDGTSPAAFRVIDDTVRQILERKQLFWLTLGATIAVWEVSGAMRAIMKALNRIYEIEERRSLRQRMLTSTMLATAGTIAILVAVALVKFGPLLVHSVLGGGFAVGTIVFVAQWLLAVLVLLLLMGALVRFAPAERRPIEWVGFGSLLVVVAWILASLIFGWYLTSVASYGSVYGNLATVIVALQYVYLSAIVFLVGVQVDAIVRAKLTRGNGLGR